MDSWPKVVWLYERALAFSLTCRIKSTARIHLKFDLRQVTAVLTAVQMFAAFCGHD